MKKIKYLLICTLIIICSGCVKYNVKMGINADKSMNLEIVYAVEKSMGGNSLKTEEINKLKKEGYKVKKYDKDSYIGYTISKKIKNIDEISTVEENIANLDITDEDKYMFQVQRGLFKNKYTYTGNKIDQGGESTLDNQNMDSKTLKSSGMEMNLVVKLPYKVDKTNATNVSKDGKELKWDLLTFKEKRIVFIFYLYNIPNIVITVIGILAMIVIVYFIAKGKKKKDQYNGNFDIQKKN